MQEGTLNCLPPGSLSADYGRNVQAGVHSGRSAAAPIPQPPRVPTARHGDRGGAAPSGCVSGLCRGPGEDGPPARGVPAAHPPPPAPPAAFSHAASTPGPALSAPVDALRTCLQVVRLEKFPQQLPEGLLLAVHAAEHVDRLVATSTAVSGPTAVRDPDDPGGCCRQLDQGQLPLLTLKDMQAEWAAACLRRGCWLIW